MQNPPIARSGDLVRVRRARWRIIDVCWYGRRAVFTLLGIGSPNRGVERRFIAPFDDIERLDRPSHVRAVRPRTWRRTCRALIASHTPPGGLLSAHRAKIELMPHQLEPALAVVRGLGSRLLLADDVGLGKTIQAGLVISELMARAAADRVLVLAPAALCDQWTEELNTRFDIGALALDALVLRRLISTLPVGLNPWTALPTVVASIDYVKRPEVLPAVRQCKWDVIVVDEAHGTAVASDRHAAVSALASQSAYVVLVTATPHNGDRQSFLSLCDTGSRSDRRLLVFRRTRRDVHLGVARHVHRLLVRPSADERRMHASLARFADAVRLERGGAATLALGVLHKRAFSSAHSLYGSVARRLTALSGSYEDGHQQLGLPLVDDVAGELTRDDEVPPWSPELALDNDRRERQLLQAVAAAAADASRAETKIAALRRLLRRIREPAVVFTEYRDTLLHLQEQLGRRAAVLHGGMARHERAASLESFRRGERILLTTDAAGEGLNLHGGCRLVVNLELPWNPMRLEQRIGRVDRIGQCRVVHAFHFIAHATGEALILDRLRTRMAAAQADVGAPDPLGLDAERAVARLVVEGVHDDTSSSSVDLSSDAGVRVRPRLATEASIEAQRLAAVRALMHAADDEALAQVEGRGPSLLRTTRWRTRSRLGARTVFIWRVACEDGRGHRIASTAIPFVFQRKLDRAGAEEFLQRCDSELRRHVDLAMAQWRRGVTSFHQAFMATRLVRERSVARLDGGSFPFQAGLFDRRGDRLQAAANSIVEQYSADRADRLAQLESGTAVVASAQLLLVLTP